MVDTAALLVDDVLPHRGVRQWVLSVPFPLRFLFARDPAAMNGALRIVIRAISAHLISKSGLGQAQAQTGSVTLIQRFGGALNLNIHFHMIFLDGVYDVRRHGRPRFIPVPAPTAVDMATLVHRISERVGRHLERRGLLVRDAESAWLDFDTERGSAMDDLAGPGCVPHCSTRLIDTEADCLHAAVHLRSVLSFPCTANLHAVASFGRRAMGRSAFLARFVTDIGPFSRRFALRYPVRLL